MKFNHTPTFASYWMLNKRHFFKIRGVKLLLFISAFSILFYLINPIMNHQWLGYDHSIGELYLSSMGILILPLIMALMFTATYIGAKKRWKSAAELRCEKTYDITDSEIHVTATGIDSHLGLQYIAEAELWRGWIFLMTNQRTYHFFPLSAVPEPDKLISMLAAKIAKTKGMKRKQSFNPQKEPERGLEDRGHGGTHRQ